MMSRMDTYKEISYLFVSTTFNEHIQTLKGMYTNSCFSNLLTAFK